MGESWGGGSFREEKVLALGLDLGPHRPPMSLNQERVHRDPAWFVGRGDPLFSPIHTSQQGTFPAPMRAAER
jgi:hypothetical protein